MQLTLSASKIWFYRDYVDFRKSIDGLVGLVHTNMGVNPSEGVFIFRNRSKDKLKILAWHGNGFILLYKRLEKGKFTVVNDPDSDSIALDGKQLSWLLAGLDWDTMSHWDGLTYDDYH